MKKFISILVCFLIMFSFSFADDTKKIEDTWYISEDAVCKMWNTDVLVYSNSSIVNFNVDNTNYYFKIGTNKVKIGSYINPFFINDRKMDFKADYILDGNTVLGDDGKVYFPISFFHKRFYADNFYDVIVMGGDPEGIAASIAVARSGGKVLLISEEDGLGGLFTFGMLNTLDMSYSKDGELLTKGIFEEFYNKEGRKESFDVNEVKKIFEDMVADEPNIDYRKNYSFSEAIIEGNTITGIRVLDENSEIKEFYGRRIIDATQDGDVCANAGVPYYVGMEDINSDEIMCVTLCFKVGGVDWEVLKDDMKKYMDETGDTGCGVTEDSAWGFGKWCYDKYTPEFDNMRLRGPNFGRQNDGTVLLNALQIFNVNVEDENSVNDAIYYGAREAQNIVKYLKTRLDSFQNAYLLGTASELYVRETRHIQGEYVLRASDLLNNRNFSDKIAMGAYPVDIQSTSKNNYGYVVFAPSQYSIPYRCAVPQKIDNLYIVGKAASFSSVAAGSARVVPTGMVMGESIGIISMYSIFNDVTPRDIIGSIEMNQEINELLVERGVYLPEYDIPGPFNGLYNKDKIERFVDLGIITGGYANNFKLNNIAVNKNAVTCITQMIKRMKLDVSEEIIEDIKAFSSNDELNMITMSKMIAKLFGEYDEEFSDFEIYLIASANGHFDSVNVKTMHDVITLQDLYVIVSDAIDRLI